MAVNLSPVYGVAGQLFDNNGNPLAGGRIFTYLAGTTTNATVYTSSSGNVAHSNPIILDGAGRVPSGEIWLTDGILYKFVVQDSANNLIGTYDNISGINSNFVAFVNQQEIITATAGQTVFNLSISYQPATNSLSVFVDGVNQYGPGAQYAYVETDANTVTFVSGLHVGAQVKFTTTQQQNAGVADASQVTYDPPFVDSVVTNVEAKLAESVSAFDFMTPAEQTDVTNRSGSLDVSDALQNAVDSLPAGGGVLYFPTGKYKITKGIQVLKNNVTLIGAGKFSTEIFPDPSFDRATYDGLFTLGDGSNNYANFVVQNMAFRSTYNNDGDDVSGMVVDAYYNVDIINCQFQSGNPDTRQTGGIFIKRGLHTRIDHCNLHNGYGYGILISGHGADLAITNCAFDETQASIVTTGNCFKMTVAGCHFGALLTNAFFPAAQVGSHIDLTTGAHGTVEIWNNRFDGSTLNNYTKYGVNFDNVADMIICNNTFADFNRMAICKRDNAAMMVIGNFFQNCGWGASTLNATLGTSNPDTTPFVPDIYSVGASTNATLIVGNRTATNTRVMSWLEGSVSGAVSSECNLIGNFASGGVAYVRGVYAYDFNNFVRGFTSPKSAPPITVSVAGFTLGANATTSGTFSYSYASTDSIIIGSVQGGALNTALTFRVEPVSGNQCRWVISNTSGSPIVQAGFDITVSLVANQ